MIETETSVVNDLIHLSVSSGYLHRIYLISQEQKEIGKKQYSVCLQIQSLYSLTTPQLLLERSQNKLLA